MINQKQLVDHARLLYSLWYSEIPESKGCLFWAAAFNAAAKEQGLDTLIQAGSAQFQFRSDDGKRDTHFSYMFEPAAGMMKFRAGELPEMHVWSWIRQTNEIVDLSLGYQPSQARELAGYEWEREFYPPSYLWVPVEKLQNFEGRYIYKPDMMATMFALCYLHDHREEHGGQSSPRRMPCTR
jgi:hypothetical protein